MKCGYCGKPLRENAKFCTNCGRSISGDFAETDNSSAPKGGSFFAAVISLILVIAVIIAGCVGLAISCMRDLNTMIKKPSVSESDLNKTVGANVSPSDTATIPEFKGDPALLGTWLCNDKTAAGYNETDYGISTRITITFNQNGTFALEYEATDTGIQVRKVTLTGMYSVNDGEFTLFPDLSGYNGGYFTADGERPSVKYSFAENILTMTTSDKHIIKFTAV
ncbi:MAG: zinc-ribbon domain-containing protein [Acutalibacteraceae bacterium]